MTFKEFKDIVVAQCREMGIAVLPPDINHSLDNFAVEGDSIRFGAATAAEDEQDLSKMELDLHLFEVYTRGYLEAANALTDTEIAMLPMGALAVTLELATRFLKDYLDGDLYFKTAYPEHNLVRARSQMKLAADMEKKLPEMNRIVAEVVAQAKK